MATCIWTGGASPIAQVTRLTVGGTIEADDKFILTIGSKSVTVVGGSTSATTVATNIAAALAALNPQLYPEFFEFTVTDNLNGTLDLTAKTPGVPFTITPTTTETGGGAADSQTFTGSDTTAASGPSFWSVAANWSGGAVPANSDTVYIQNSAVPILYGLAQSAVTLAALYVDQSFTGTVGLPVTNAKGYPEYRATYLAIGATAIKIGNGTGPGSGRVKINTGTVQTALVIDQTGTPAEPARKSVIWKGTHASNTVTINAGSFEAGPFASETYTIATYKQGFLTSVNTDSDCRLASGGTLTTLTKTGGVLDLNASFTTLNHTGGTTEINAGTPGTLNINGGTVIYATAGTYTAATVGNGGALDFSQDLQARTGTNTTVNGGGILRDPHKTVTFTNPIAFTCPFDSKLVNLGQTYNLQRS